ncbi:bifunctional 3-(3-hydroxy-phenyl)propionate/3-hydroxycinnamic acid hydroxylase [Ottowia thiooxydans]|uniref:bifunctional 3-(3-hydroxy-phenyl)propionate/3-hydroxycinnamic acid hydroxylase n=1 Tax=Ottowia thiooxydans TaxID=219182 RepID=UPI0004187F9F|nr:bifunctional 3-(3-hydroxy-phenyl)propionate/3-hydroxycinnamic acid hydroxylase [Ottowia thiooxydans]
MPQCFDVLIIGYGPAGATMANLLGQRGYSVAVVESATAIYDKPRAITADQEAMRVFQHCGLAQEMEQGTCPHPGTDFVGMQGQVIKRFYPQPPPQLLAWEPTWMFVQPELEVKLRKGVERFPKVQVFLGHELLQLQQNENEVCADIRRLSDGEQIRLRSRYTIACDGARSSVRRQMNGEIEDLAFDEWWIVVDAWLRADADLPERCVQYCRPSRPGTYIVGPNSLRRWEIKMLPGELPEQFDNEAAIRKVLAEFTNPEALDLCRTAIYRFHALVAKQWRFGRVFLMGDSAHQMPPFLGQGLCAAIRDTINLAWKLDAVERLGASPKLLDTYAEERTPHVRTVVSHAKSFGLIIGELDEAAARIRDQRMEEELLSGQAESVRQKFIPGLTTGLIAMDTQQCPAPGAGVLFVQPWVKTAVNLAFQRLDDLASPGFLLVSNDVSALDGMSASTASFWQRIAGQRVWIGTVPPSPSVAPDVLAVQERDGVFSTWLQSLGAKVAVIRPDRYVYGVAQSAEELPHLLLALESALFGAHPSATAAGQASAREPATLAN